MFVGEFWTLVNLESLNRTADDSLGRHRHRGLSRIWPGRPQTLVMTDTCRGSSVSGDLSLHRLRVCVTVHLRECAYLDEAMFKTEAQREWGVKWELDAEQLLNGAVRRSGCTWSESQCHRSLSPASFWRLTPFFLPSIYPSFLLAFPFLSFFLFVFPSVCLLLVNVKKSLNRGQNKTDRVRQEEILCDKVIDNLFDICLVLSCFKVTAYIGTTSDLAKSQRLCDIFFCGFKQIWMQKQPTGVRSLLIYYWFIHSFFHLFARLQKRQGLICSACVPWFLGLA